MNALEFALVAHNRPDYAGEEQRLDDARKLNSFGVFSANHIWLITGLPHQVVRREIQKTSKTGGRFNPGALPLIYDFWLSYSEYGVKDTRMLEIVLGQGVSLGFVAKLTGINKSTMAYWLKESRRGQEDHQGPAVPSELGADEHAHSQRAPRNLAKARRAVEGAAAHD